MQFKTNSNINKLQKITKALSAFSIGLLVLSQAEERPKATDHQAKVSKVFLGMYGCTNVIINPDFCFIHPHQCVYNLESVDLWQWQNQ